MHWGELPKEGNNPKLNEKKKSEENEECPGCQCDKFIHKESDNLLDDCSVIREETGAERWRHEKSDWLLSLGEISNSPISCSVKFCLIKIMNFTVNFTDFLSEY